MKLLAILTIVLAYSLYAGAQGQQSGISVTLAALKNTVRLGSPIKVRVTVTNTSGKNVALARSLGDEEAEFNFDFRVIDSRGKKAIESEHRKQVKGEGSSAVTHSNQIVPLRPGEAITEMTDISKLYDLGHSGVYKIRVNRTLPAELGGGTVLSNQIRITIVP